MGFCMFCENILPPPVEPGGGSGRVTGHTGQPLATLVSVTGPGRTGTTIGGDSLGTALYQDEGGNWLTGNRPWASRAGRPPRYRAQLCICKRPMPTKDIWGCHMHIPESLRNPLAKFPIPLNKILCQYGRLWIVHSLLSQDILITLESRCIDESMKKLIVFDAWQTLHMFYFLPLHNYPSARCHEVTNKNMTYERRGAVDSVSELTGGNR